MPRPILSVVLVGAVFFTGCSSTSRSESHLVGKWQTEADQSSAGRKGIRPLETQFQFFAGGTVVQNQKILGKWEQFGTGTFTFIDATHLKIDLGWAVGATVYEIEWPDSDHLKLRAADRATQLVRVL
jgi:hypothetical protein